LNVHDYVGSFFVIFPWSHDLEKVTPLSVWLGVRRTPRVYVLHWRIWELLAFEYVKTNADKKKQVSKNLIYAACFSSLTIGKII